MRGTDVPLVLIGRAAAGAAGYGRAVVQSVDRTPGMLYLDGLPYESPLLPSAYAVARVHVLPSLAETQPLTVLEAAAAGANLVVADLPDLRASFGEYAWYCDPYSVQSIRDAVLAAYRAPRGSRYTVCPPWLVSWREVAERLRAVYQDVLSTQS